MKELILLHWKLEESRKKREAVVNFKESNEQLKVVKCDK